MARSLHARHRALLGWLDMRAVLGWLDMPFQMAEGGRLERWRLAERRAGGSRVGLVPRHGPAQRGRDGAGRVVQGRVVGLAARARPEDERHPRLRLLYHPDLDRIGALSLPGALSARWFTLGRNDPPFGGLGDATLPIDDPHVSREQLRVRWLPDVQRFEVEPLALAREACRPGRPSPGLGRRPRRVAHHGPTVLEPGACVAGSGTAPSWARFLTRVRPVDEDRIGLVGESEPLWALRDEIASVAQFGGAALVMGPTGAGKDVGGARHPRVQRACAGNRSCPSTAAAVPSSRWWSPWCSSATGQRRVHRRRRRGHRALPRGGRRHALPRRAGGAAPAGAAQAAARAPGRGRGAGRRVRGPARRRAGGGSHEPRPRGPGAGGRAARGSLSPRDGARAPRALARRAPLRRAGAVRAHAAPSPGRAPVARVAVGGQDDVAPAAADRLRRRSCCAAGRGRATCASSRTWSSGRRA